MLTGTSKPFLLILVSICLIKSDQTDLYLSSLYYNIRVHIYNILFHPKLFSQKKKQFGSGRYCQQREDGLLIYRIMHFRMMSQYNNYYLLNMNLNSSY